MPAGFPDVEKLPFKSHGYEFGRKAEYKKWNFEFVPRIAFNWWKCEDYVDSTEGLAQAVTKVLFEEEDRLEAMSDFQHSMFAGPHPRHPDEKVEPYTWTTEKLPLLGLMDDDDLGFWVSICDYGLVFNVAKDQLKDGIFEPAFAMPTNVMA